MSGHNSIATVQRASTTVPTFSRLHAPRMMYSSSPEQSIYRYPVVPYPVGVFAGSSPRHHYGVYGPGRNCPADTVATVTVNPTSSETSVNNAGTITSEDASPSATAAEIATSDLASAAGGDSPAAEQPGENSVANTKEKTPMCLINELARFNKASHQYCLTDEQGPAHKKTFFVKLKLGDEEFAASGPSIKKAQHAAANVALEQTKYKHPPMKRQSLNANTACKAGINNSVTPTVELNALAMKRGEVAVYRPFERRVTQPQFNAPPYDYRGGYFNQRYRYPRPPRQFYVALKVGQRDFVGEGETLQVARHSAAAMALKVLRNLPLPQRQQPNTTDTVDESVSDTSAAAAVETDELLKSEISFVHEIALKRNFTVVFETMKEFGPPHMRTFVTRCKCGSLETEAEGNSKKLSKKRAAEKMVVELKKLPPLPSPPNSDKLKKNFTKPKQSKNLIKSVLNNPMVGVNPISRLIQIQQAKKEKEPTFLQLAETSSQSRLREFVVQVTVGDTVCTGNGPNKKLAKRNAAEQMLNLLGYIHPVHPSKPALKSSTSDSTVSATAAAGAPSPPATTDKKVTFVEPDVTPPKQQSVPGLIRVPQPTDGSTLGPGNTTGPREIQHNRNLREQQSLGERVINSGRQRAKDQAVRATVSASVTPVTSCTVRPLDQLKYLSKLMHFEFMITNIPKENKEYLTMLTLCTNPPQFYNGSGGSVDTANDSAAVEAMRKLTEVGLGDGGGSDSTPPAAGPTTSGNAGGRNSCNGRTGPPERTTAVVTSTAAKLEAK